MSLNIWGGTGQKASIGTSSVAIVGSSTLAQTRCVIKAASGNSTNFVYVGNTSSVTTATGFQLAANAEEPFDVGFFQGDLANLYVIGSTTGLAVSFWYV